MIYKKVTKKNAPHLYPEVPKTKPRGNLGHCIGCGTVIYLGCGIQGDDCNECEEGRKERLCIVSRGDRQGWWNVDHKKG